MTSDNHLLLVIFRWLLVTRHLSLFFVSLQSDRELKTITMSTIVEKPKKTAKKPKKAAFVAPVEEISTEKKSLLDYAKEIAKNPPVYREEIIEDNSTEKNVEKKKTLWDVAEELAEKPLIRVLDEDLVYGSNMMTRLLQEEEL